MPRNDISSNMIHLVWYIFKAFIFFLLKAPSYDMEQDGMFFARKTNVKEAVLVFVKEKGGKYSAARVRVHKN